MLVRWLLTFAILAFGAGSYGAFAAPAVPTVRQDLSAAIPQQPAAEPGLLAIRQKPETAAAAFETPAAISGLTYTIATPVPNPRVASTVANGYIRFMNGSNASADIEVKVVGLQTGNLYGGVTYIIPANSAPQLTTARVLDDSNIAGPTGIDGGFAYWLKASHTITGFAQINYNPSTGAFENATHCAQTTAEDFTWINTLVPNLHTTQLAGYPSLLNIYNKYDHAVQYQIDVYNGANGVYINSFNQTIPANQNFNIGSAQIQMRIGLTPTTELHLNAFVFPLTAASETVTTAHFVFFAGFGGNLATLVAMSNFCPIHGP